MHKLRTAALWTGPQLKSRALFSHQGGGQTTVGTFSTLLKSTRRAAMMCRLRTYEAFGQSDDPRINVACSDPSLDGEHLTFEEMLSDMESAVFCLVITGDAMSTRRLSEIFMAGEPVVHGSVPAG